MKKIITKAIYRIYNLLQGNKIEKYYKFVKAKNDTNTPLSEEEISDYLKKWGFTKAFVKNPLMDKIDLKEWIVKVDKNKIHTWAYTGGSYGEPLRVPYSKKRALIRTATFKYFNELAGYNLGDSFALIRAKNKSKIIKFLRNETIIVPHDISKPQLDHMFNKLIENKVVVLMGYPTVMYEMALHLKEYPGIKKNLKIKSLISVSEMLEPDKRDVIKNTFNCMFVDRYSNEEVGLIAQQKKFQGPYFVNKFGVYVEIVDPETLEPVNEGEQGKVVVTDLYNELTPILRYDTGDLAIAGKYQEGHLITIKKILGRVAEKIFDTEDNPVSSLALGPAIYKPFAREECLYQFQFAQIGKKSYELRVKNNKEEINNNLQNEVVTGLKKILGFNSDIFFVTVKDIQPQPSGKRPIYVNEMNSDYVETIN